MDNKYIIEFLTDLSVNNNRDWFAANKERYTYALDLFKQQVAALIEAIGLFDPSVKHLTADACIFRIYRDTRFSHDKTPYKNHFGAYIAHAGGRKSPYAGYYLHLEPGNSIISGGLYYPDNNLLKLVRKEINSCFEEFQEITLNADFKHYFGEIITPESLKRLPADFSANSPAAKWLKFKHFLVEHALSETDIAAKDFTTHAAKVCKTMLPFNHFFNTIIEEKSLPKR